MATFESQVEGMTSLSIAGSGTTPTQSELSQFLTDGAKDVINRLVSAKPEEAINFSETLYDADNSGVPVNGNILTVVREQDSSSVLRSCNKINPQDRYEATNTDSLKYTSAYNPGFYVLNGKVFTTPISASNNRAVVTQVRYPELTYSNSSVVNFPSKYEHLIIYYASMMSLQAKTASLHEDSNLTTALTAINDNTDSALTEISNLKTELLNSKTALESAGTLNRVESALVKAQKLFSDDAGFSSLSDVTDDLSNSTSITGWLEEEDPEMVTTTINAIGAELKRAELELKTWAAKTSNSENYLKVAGGYGTSIENYLKVAQGYAAEVAQRIQYLNQEYTWYMYNYNEIKRKYDEAFLSEAQIEKRRENARQMKLRQQSKSRKRK